MSEVGSGTDASARVKKSKTKHTTSRPDTPSGHARRVRTGAGSDTDGATMSDAGSRRLNPKTAHRVGGSNVPSRAGSPAPGAAGIPSRSGAASPSAGAPDLPTLDAMREILRASMPTGLTTAEFLKRVPHARARFHEFSAQLKQIAKTEDRDGTKFLVLKD